MTNCKLRSIIAEAVALDREITESKARLAEIEDQLKAEAETRAEEHKPTDGGGWSWTAEGADGCIARVTQEGGKLKASISSDKDIGRAKDICGVVVFSQLFEPRVQFKLVADFRDRAAVALGKSAAKLIKAFSTKGNRKVSYETKEAA